MHQEQSLNMNLSQHLAMTMKLQQAIQILQLSAQDLKAEIEKEYLENPALEMEYGETLDGSTYTDADDVTRFATKFEVSVKVYSRTVSCEEISHLAPSGACLRNREKTAEKICRKMASSTMIS